ncbi:MAG: hypothetical protein GY765_24335 [bacterium]|nr:hypothetical protein [bacterium]
MIKKSVYIFCFLVVGLMVLVPKLGGTSCFCQSDRTLARLDAVCEFECRRHGGCWGWEKTGGSCQGYVFCSVDYRLYCNPQAGDTSKGYIFDHHFEYCPQQCKIKFPTTTEAADIRSKSNDKKTN